MAHSKPPILELTGKWNKVINPTGVRRKQFVMRDTRGMDDRALRDESAYRGSADKPEIDGKVLDKPIQIYRMWYRFLQLALELEEQKVSLIVRKEKLKLKTPRKDKWGKLQKFEMRDVLRKVKVNHKAYEGWDLDLIPTTSFDDWWKGKKSAGISAHRELFYSDNSTIIVGKKDDWVDSPNYAYVRVDKRRRINDIVDDLRDLFAKQSRELESTSDFPVTGRPNINTLINRYNALVMQLTSKKSDMEILSSGIFRKTSERQLIPTKYDDETDAKFDEVLGVYRVGKSLSDGQFERIGRTMRDLILPAKITLLSVCDGYFISNPNKDYLKK